MGSRRSDQWVGLNFVKGGKERGDTEGVSVGKVRGDGERQ